jgi:hypothetical protein
VLLVALADLHLARLGLLQNRDPDLEDTIVVGGLDGVGVQVLGQGQAAREGTERALADEELVALGALFRVTLTDRTPRSTVTLIVCGSMPGTSNRSRTSSSRRTPSSGMTLAWPNARRVARANGS